jgi:eukaryotic-like serine/threonine-protein kinase
LWSISVENSRLKRLVSEWSGKDLNGWTVGEYINAGKSALVFKAKKKETDAAVKIFDPEIIERFGSAEEMERIKRELRLVGERHENLVQIFDGGHSKEHDLYFIVMEYIDAPNLASVLKEVPNDRIRPIIAQVASAARFLEGLNIAHRDIKPDNICISRDFQQATLLDLGVIRPSGANNAPPLTDRDEQLFIGTLQYASPEFLLRREEQNAEGHRSLTFYQLGAVLYDMLEKRRIFAESASPFARLVQAILHDNPKLDSAGNAPDLASLASNCLVKDPNLRLRIVAWEDFAPTLNVSDGTAAAKESIRKRRARALYDTQSIDSSSAHEESRRRKQISGVVLSRIAEQVRAASDESDLPPRTVKEVPDEEGKESLLLACFKASAKFGLSVDFHLAFKLSLLDLNGQVVELQCAAMASTKQIAESHFSHHFSTIFSGVYEDAVVRTALEGALFPALERTMGMQGPLEPTSISISKAVANP